MYVLRRKYIDKDACLPEYKMYKSKLKTGQKACYSWKFIKKRKKPIIFASQGFLVHSAPLNYGFMGSDNWPKTLAWLVKMCFMI